MRNMLLELDVPTPEVAVEAASDDLFVPKGYEMVDGKLVEMSMGARSGEIAANITELVKAHVKARKLAKVFPSEVSYQIFVDAPKRVRKADASLVLAGRFPDDKTPNGNVRIPPDLAVEVVSPNDLADEVESKRVEWLRAGVRILWIAYPSTSCVHRYRPDGQSSVVGPDGELSGEDVLPGFVCRVADVFA